MSHRLAMIGKNLKAHRYASFHVDNVDKKVEVQKLVLILLSISNDFTVGFLIWFKIGSLGLCFRAKPSDF